MKKLLSFLSFALIGHFSYSQNYTPQESNKRSIYLMPVRVDSVASSAYKRVLTRYLNGAYGTVVSASTYTSNGEERIMVSRTSNTTITLGSKDCVQGKSIIIQDLAGTRSSGNYIQIQSSTGNVNGASYLRIETGGGSSNLYFDGTNWKINSLQAPWDGAVLLVSDGHLTGYSSIGLANAVAVSGDVMVLQDDIVLEETLVLPSGVSINGNGKTITMPISGAGIEITAGNCNIFNVKKLLGTAGTDAQNSSHTIYIHGSTAVATIQIDEIALGKSPILNAGDDAQVFLNVKKIDLGTDNQYNIYSWRKIFVSAGAFVKLTGATVTGGTGTGSFGSVVHSGGASFADRSILEVENCWINIGCGAFIAERGGELRCTNLNVTTALDRSIFGSHYGEAGQPYGVMIFKDSKFFSGSTQVSSPTANSCFWTLGGIWYCEFHGVNEFNDGGATSYTMVDGSGAGTYDWKNYGKLYVNKAANISLFDAGYNAEIIWPEVPSGGGAVTTVTASSPLASSGGTTPNISVSGTIGVANGGTGATSFTANRILYGNGTSAIGSSANLTFDGSKFSVAGAADAFLVTSTGSGVTSQLEQTSNNDVLHRFKRNGGNYWDLRYYYTGEALKFSYNDTPVLTLNSSGSATLAGELNANGQLNANANLVVTGTTNMGGLSISSTGRVASSALAPDVDNVRQLGLSGKEWSSVWSRSYIVNDATVIDASRNGTFGNVSTTGALTIGSTTASTSTTTGSATFAGGIGIAGAVNAGLASTFASSVTVGSGANVGYTFQTNGTSYFTGQATFGGAIVINAGINSAADIDFKYLGGNYGKMFTSGNWLFRSSGTFTDIPSSKLSVESTTQGSIPAPKMTSTQRDAISSPTAGLQVFNTTTNTLQSYNGSAWGEVGRVLNGSLSVNGLTAGATSDTTVVVNAGVFKKILRSTQVDYAAWSGTDTWDGSAPSGTETHTYGYKVEGKTVTGWIRLEYTGGGSTNTYVDIELSAFPAPSIPAYVGSGETAFAANGFLATSNTANPVASMAWLYEASGALKLKILAASNGYQFAMATFTYQIP